VKVKSVTPESPVGLDQIIHRDVSLSLSLSLALGVQNLFRIDLRATTYLSVSSVCVCVCVHIILVLSVHSSLLLQRWNSMPISLVDTFRAKRQSERQRAKKQAGR
jgi:hypothetical protein